MRPYMILSRSVSVLSEGRRAGTLPWLSALRPSCRVLRGRSVGPFEAVGLRIEGDLFEAVRKDRWAPTASNGPDTSSSQNTARRVKRA